MRLWEYLLTPRTFKTSTRSGIPLGEFESGFSGVYKIAVAVSRIDCDEGSLGSLYLLSASTTMKMTLSNGALDVTMLSLLCANPGMNGL